MALNVEEIQARLTKQFGDAVSHFRIEYDIPACDVQPGQLHKVIRFMQQDPVLRFNFLTDLCGVHYPDHQEASRLAVAYLLHNWADNIRLRIKTYTGEADPQIDTVTDLFESANWMERETYDFYGIVFRGHPNLKRILNVESMVSFPMRKEHPLEDAGRSDKDDRFFGRSTHNKPSHPIEYQHH